MFRPQGSRWRSLRYPAFYSYDIGNVHFLSLDSYGKEDSNSTRLYDTAGAQVQWIKKDLTAFNITWMPMPIILFLISG